MKEDGPSQMELRIPRSCEFVRVARKAAGALAHQLAFGLQDVWDVELAVSEACTNAIEHVPGESCEEILLRFVVEPERLVMEVVDRGPGFDPTQVDEGGGDEDSPGGLGMLVIRGVMDDVEVECDPDTGTCVRMVKCRKGK